MNRTTNPATNRPTGLLAALAAIIFFVSPAIVGIAAPTAAALAPVLETAANLQTMSCSVTAENHRNRRTSTITYDFSFKRSGEKMRIRYTAPRNMKGTTIAIDGEYFYSYMPNLNRTMKRKLSADSATKNPGEDMGLFFHFVRGDFADQIEGMEISPQGEEQVRILQGKNRVTVTASHVTFSQGAIRQEVWFDSALHVPVKVEIYRGGKLDVKIFISAVKLNEPLADSLFSLSR